MKDVDFKVFSGPAAADGRVVAARARRRRDEPRRDRRLHRVREDLRRQGPRLDQGQRREQGPRRPQSADREEPARRRARRDRCWPHRRRLRRPDLLRRRQGQGRQRRHRRARVRSATASSARRAAWCRAVAAAGWSTSRCSSTTTTRSAGTRCTTLHQPEGRPRGLARPQPGAAMHKAYDVVLNGIELGGSVRIHREEVQSKVFRALKIDAEEAQRSSACFARCAAVRRAAARRHRDRPGPLRDADDRRREPARRDHGSRKTQRAQCLLTNAPSAVDEAAARAAHPPAQPDAGRLGGTGFAHAESEGAARRPFFLCACPPSDRTRSRNPCSIVITRPSARCC